MKRKKWKKPRVEGKKKKKRQWKKGYEKQAMRGRRKSGKIENGCNRGNLLEDSYDEEDKNPD
jgi:hypothetical protein